MTAATLTQALRSTRILGRPLAHRAVRVRHARNVSVFTRCNESTAARAGDASCATSPNLTSVAPISASLNMKTVESTAPNLAACRLGNARNVQAKSPKTIAASIPVMDRCTNSITVAIDGVPMTTCPLHKGQ